jgi:SAM-dependent methyltransferase
VSSLVAWMDRTFYAAYSDNWDDALFRQWIERRLRTQDQVLDVGAGAGIVPHMNFRGRAARVCGVDLDERVRQNPFLDESRVASAASIPHPNATFDLVFSDNVLEHLSDPLAAFREVHRVLKPGGRFLMKTPNRSHYVPLLARLTPLRFHRFLNRLRGRAAADTFPTTYRANSPQQIRMLAGDAGFTVRRIELVEGRPEYLRLSAFTYAFGVLYERFVNGLPCLARFRVLLLAELDKPTQVRGGP